MSSSSCITTKSSGADTIGASIEINTTSAFQRLKPLTVFSLEGSYNDATDKGRRRPRSISRRFDDRIGVAGGLSYYKRRFATDNVEVDGWNETDEGLVFADTVEYRDYDVTRERLGGCLWVYLEATDSAQLYVRGLYSRFGRTGRLTGMPKGSREARRPPWRPDWRGDPAVRGAASLTSTTWPRPPRAGRRRRGAGFRPLR